MIECQNCRHKEIPGALFCSECGAQLTEISFSTQTIRGGVTDKFAKAATSQPAPAPPKPALDTDISLYLMDTGTILPLEGRTEYTLGRSAEGQPILPDIDLAPHRGYEHGVSRLHASIALHDEEVVTTDLGSANGTLVNGQKITPHKPHPVKHGDILSLGKLKIQLLIRH